jgi:hypothetical protein
VKEKNNEEEEKETFIASVGWFERFKNQVSCIMLILTVRQLVQMRMQHLNILMLKKIIKDCGYTHQQYLTWMKPVHSGKGCFPELTFLRKKILNLDLKCLNIT